MKAAFTPEYGSPEVLEIRDMPRPEVGADDILIEIRSAAITEGDRRMRAADFPGIFAYIGQLIIGVGSPRQKVQGTMYAGRVVEVGTNVTRFAVGDDVFGAADAGAWAELISVPAASGVAHMPSNMSYDEAATVPYGAVTSLVFLKELAHVQPGEKVLVLGASGGVGRWAVQLAAALGADVTGVASAANAGLVKALGAKRVLDYATQDFASGDERYDVVFDIAGASSFFGSRRVLRPGGRYMTVFAAPMVMVLMLLTKFFGTRRAICGLAMTSSAHLEELRGLIEEGKLQASVCASYDLSEIVAAHHEEARVRNGDIVVRPSTAPVRLRAVA